MVLSGSLLVVLLVPVTARAGGVDFPNSQSVFAPADRPSEIVVSTNFGLVMSEDGGRTWTWSCEHGTFPRLPQAPYQLGPAPRDRLFAFGGGLEYSDDGACTWKLSGGLLAAGYQVARLSVDPTNADRVLASAGLGDGDGGFTYAVLESTDGGATFDSIRYTSEGGLITSIGIAQTDPMTIYLTSYAGRTGPPTLVRSDDAGATWHPLDLSAAIGPGSIDIIAVDPSRADKLFLRQVTATDEAFVVVVNGGATATRALALSLENEIAFVRTADGTLLVSALARNTTMLFRSDDGGATFAPVPGPPHIHGMAERNGVLYAATDSIQDDFGEATSIDDGTTWQPGMSYNQVQAVNGCAKAACQDSCNFWASMYLWSEAVCSADLPAPDAGAGAADAATSEDAAVGGKFGGSATDGSAGAGGSRAALVSSSGCRCSLEADPGSGLRALGALFLSLLWLRRHGRCRLRGARQSNQRSR